MQLLIVLFSKSYFSQMYLPNMFQKKGYNGDVYMFNVHL